LDDTGLRLPPDFDDSAAAAVRDFSSRLAGGGLRVRADKSLAIAMHGRTFTSDERRRLAELKLPFVDASTPAQQRGFTTVGVPVGSPEYVASALRNKLMDPPTWRLAWQLVGMARTNFQAAFRVFRRSLATRMGYLARNVDPDVGEAWFGGFDGFCAWVLDRLCHLHHTATAAQMQQHLDKACTSGDTHAAADGSPLVLPTLGPEGMPVPRLPLQVARMPTRDGGLGHHTCT